MSNIESIFKKSDFIHDVWNIFFLLLEKYYLKIILLISSI